MTPENKTEFEWITTRLTELAVASQNGSTRSIALALRPKLTAHISELFPDLALSMTNLPDDAIAVNRGAMELIGPGLWKQLHTRAKTAPQDTVAEMTWLQKFSSELPCGDCRGFYIAYLKQHPPNFADYQGWMIGLHNAVNAKLKKPILTDSQARAIWA